MLVARSGEVKIRPRNHYRLFYRRGADRESQRREKTPRFLG